ncbi:MAG: hypothetical protein A2648_02260 [Candidatus Lloydbacteria bacterium RIFCSPHIGHO2_01_FULL_41_20]|uniref:Uncharacterized protein n=1 Tax=Candidatus Lloydbacteria bacterium RIFCSPHIGHO2_01_FULL_41_20 TaxID=1798657 RepID=A0A1G2CQT9_9BACT|nr:MAG: hypothetical protein A2648_02260 [Candidatus Lloydbacteria bacterium RIFCSPHIGHO2_01_FULL_41_20]
MKNNNIWSRIRKQIIDFCEYMIWKITERHLLYKLRQKQRRKSEGRGWFGNEWRSGNFWDYLRKNYGVHKEEFKQELFAEEFGYIWYTKWLKALYQKCRPVYHEYFTADLKLTLENLIKNGYITETSRPEGIFIKEDAEKVRPILAWYYYPKIILEWEPTRDLIGKAIKWIVIFILGFLGISAIINK